MKTGDKWTAVRCLLNLILKDTRLYCNNCDNDYDEKEPICCESPQIGSHMTHLKAVAKQNESHRELMKDEFGSMKNKDMRWGISMPPRVFHILNKTFLRTYNEKLFRDQKDMHKFMKAFPAFKVCNKI